MKFKLKNVTTPDYKPPATWEEFKDLDRPARIIAARYFVRQAAVRLHDFGLRPDEVINAFDGVPPWISHQLHEHKRELIELRKDWVCRGEDCGYRGLKYEFFEHPDQLNLLDEAPMARCPACGVCDCEEYVEPAPEEQQMPGVELAPLGEVKKMDESQEESGDTKAPKEPWPEFSFKGVDVPAQPCDCEGVACPVCQSMHVPEDMLPTIENHECSLCKTVYCKTCHGIKEAQLSRAYDAVQRCRC